MAGPSGRFFGCGTGYYDHRGGGVVAKRQGKRGIGDGEVRGMDLKFGI